jgi:hypothetical protein
LSYCLVGAVAVLLETITYRYIPIGYMTPIRGDYSYNSTYQIYMTNTTETLRGFPGSIAVNAASIVALVIFIGILLLLMLYLISVTTPPKIAREMIPRPRSVNMEIEDLPGYVYTGVKKILRDIYVSIKERSCRACTPRELAYRGAITPQFAELYERVVYGNIYEEGVLKKLAEMGLIKEEESNNNG